MESRLLNVVDVLAFEGFLEDLQVQVIFVVDGAGVEDEQTEEALGNDVKDSVEDGLAVYGQSVGAFGEDPDDGVEEPGEDGEVGDVGVVPEEEDVVEAEVSGSGLELANEVEDGDEAEHGKGEKEPLPAVAYDGGDETGDDHEHIHEEDVGHLVIGATSEVDEGVKHDRGGKYPVNVTSVEELTAVTAASEGAVARGHGEVGEGGNEANKTFSNERGGKEGKITTALGVRVSVTAVGKATVEENPGAQEKDAEANPSGYAAGGTKSVIASVDGASGLNHQLAVAGTFFLSAVGLSRLSSIGGLLVVLRFIGGGSVFDASNASAGGYVEVRGVAGASRDAALGGSHVCRGFSGSV